MQSTQQSRYLKKFQFISGMIIWLMLVKKLFRKMKDVECLDNFDTTQAAKKSRICHGCMLGKQHKKSYPVNPAKVRSTLPGEFVHADVVGPMKVQSIGGARYFLLFKDDCTGYRYVYFLK
jgi:hypothetical protein